MSRRFTVGVVLLAAVVCAREAAAANYLSTRSRPAALQPGPNDPYPSSNVCLQNRRIEFDPGGTIVFTSATYPTFEEEAAIRTAIEAWNAALGTSVRLEYGGVADNADFLGFADPAGPCAADCQELQTNTLDTIELNASDGSCPMSDASDTLLAKPGGPGSWQVHKFCSTESYWSITGSRIRIAPGVTGAGLVRAIAHEIGMALGFAPHDCPPEAPCVLDPDFDTSAGSPPYAVSLGSYDLEAVAATYPGSDIAAPSYVCGGSTGNTATITNPIAGATYSWTALDGATITSVQATSVTFTAPAFSGYIFCITSPCPQQAVRLKVTASAACSTPGLDPPTYPAPGYVSISVVPGKYEVSPFVANYPSSGGSGSIQVTATKSCGGWTATAPQGSFVTITSGSTGSGNGSVQYSVGANSSPYSRSSTLTVAGQTVEITQSGAGLGTFSLTATAGSSQVLLSWTAMAGASSYSVSRRTASGSFVTVASNIFGLATTDPDVYETAYLYRVSAYDGTGFIAHSNVDLAVMKSYSAGSLSVGSVVRAEDFSQLQEAIDYARSVVDWPEASFTQILPGGPILRSHLIELRTEADRVRGALGLGGFPYTDPSITAGLTKTKAAHVLNLRDAMR